MIFLKINDLLLSPQEKNKIERGDKNRYLSQIDRLSVTIRKNFRQTRLMNSSQILTRAALAVSSEVRALESASEE